MEQLEAQENILVKLMKTDQHMCQLLTTSRDETLAETLIQKKLKDIGLSEKEIAVLLMAQGMNMTPQQAMSRTGLSQTELDIIHDQAVYKVNDFIDRLTGKTSIGNIFDVFKKSGPNE